MVERFDLTVLVPQLRRHMLIPPLLRLRQFVALTVHFQGMPAVVFAVLCIFLPILHRMSIDIRSILCYLVVRRNPLLKKASCYLHSLEGLRFFIFTICLPHIHDIIEHHRVLCGYANNHISGISVSPTLRSTSECANCLKLSFRLCFKSFNLFVLPDFRISSKFCADSSLSL